MLTVCDALKKEYQELKDEDLYRHARLVTSVVIAKVHTIDWYGLLGKKFKDMFGHIGRGFMLSGYLGMKKPENHGMPYSLTEEFVRVYRMHQLLPDALQLRNINATPSSVTWRIFVQHNVHLYLLLCSTIK
ncbi:Alpha-dioxygenase 1 [Capsicum chinense]|nr:Alpha-dioxygenase 1 [Capsicum chinense]